LQQIKPHIYQYLDTIYNKKQGENMKIEETLKSLINVINYPFKEPKELEMILRKRLTKKEFKLFRELASNTPKEEIAKKLNFDAHEFKRVEQNLIKKLNLEQTKQLLYSYN